ncbi:MAG: hypothetical protein B7733_07410 [Myxococcales bacterium FL481]|nr:MAG: hypothetical protein B7733_07410 [Myxococcales bacterium FL481]
MLGMIKTRRDARQAIMEFADSDRFAANQEFLNREMAKLRSHRLFSHEFLEIARADRLAPRTVAALHTDFLTLADQFTDVILSAQRRVRGIADRHQEPYMPARFLLMLNLFDELGFVECDNGIDGSYRQSHYHLFQDVVRRASRGYERASGGSVGGQIHQFVEQNMDDLIVMLVYLAVGEEKIIAYSPLMRQAAESVGVDVSRGYYRVHGSTADVDSDACDDLHQQDALLIMAQYMHPSDHPRVSQLFQSLADMWYEYWGQYVAYNESRQAS